MSDIDQGMMPPHVRPRQPDDEVDEKAANPRAADDDEQNKPPVPRRIAAEQDVEAEPGKPGSETR